MPFPALVSLWLWLSALATAAGWLLSAFGQLNRGGYLVFTVVALVGWLLARSLLKRVIQVGPDRRLQLAVILARLLRRFRRPLPFAFALLALLIFLGGALYPPSNHTALTYRTERVLHWLAEGRWHWIYTPNHRLNNRACGIEWLSAPLLLFTRSDREIFLLNFVPFLLLPGLLFSLWRRLGVRSRVAWHWMWLLPTGYCFLLQAGSAGNDAFPTVYALAALDFACRAWTSRHLAGLWHSVLGAALLVGAKASNLPLLLPWAILTAPLLPLVWGGKPWSFRSPMHTQPGPRAHVPLKITLTVGVAALALLVSFLPTAVLNIIYCHSWSGMQLERAGMDMKNPLVGIWGNAFLFLLHNFIPPVFPLAHWWNESALAFLPQALVRPLVANFEQSFHFVGELPTEDWAGLGFGVSLLLVVSAMASLFMKSGRPSDTPGQSVIPRFCLVGARVTPWIALLAYCMKSGMVTGARLVSPYYPFLFTVLLIMPGQAEVVRRAWWRVTVWCVVALAFAVLIVTPGRPLWPAETILSNLAAAQPESRLLSRALNVYAVYAGRSDPLACVRPLLPADLRRVGFLGNPDDIDISLWRPFGTRRVLHVLLNDPPQAIRQRNIEYVVVGGFNLNENGMTIQSWLDRTGAQLVATTNATLRVAEGRQDWYVTRLR
jgi:hypothetical protein